MNRQEVLEDIREERATLDRIVEGLSEEQLQGELWEGQTVKELLAHITSWEERLVGWLEVIKRGETPVFPEPGRTWDDLDLINAEMHAAKRDMTPDEVLAAYHRSFEQAYSLVASLSEEEMTQDGYWPWAKGNLIRLIDANMGEHYEEHAEHLRAWLEQVEHEAEA
jgi:hypothetical protein